MTNQHPHPAAYLAALFLAADDIIPFDDQNIFHAAEIITTAIAEHDTHLDILQAALVAQRTASWPIDPHTGARVMPKSNMCGSFSAWACAICDKPEGHEGMHNGFGTDHQTRYNWE